MLQPSLSQHSFASIPKNPLQRSSFDRSHGLKTTMNVNELTPIFVDEVLPGDTFNLTANLFGRLTSRVKTPLMDNLYLDTFFFYVPYRLVWSHWQQFMGERDEPADILTPPTYVVPPLKFTATPVTVGSLPDYFGLPLGFGANANAENLCSALPFRAYNLIWNEWFRDQNLQDPAVVDKGDTDSNDWDVLYPVKVRGKRHDYFTSALPWPQKGAAVTLPLGGSAPVVPLTATTTEPKFVTQDNVTIQRSLNVSNANPNFMYASGANIVGGVDRALSWHTTGLEADLSGATAVTINALREAITVQQLLEADARGGTRYTEILRSHFGVISPDARLQRPEYLGGGSQAININPIQATDNANLGNVASFGTMSHKSGFAHSFVEHGVIIGLASIRADLTYQQGLARPWQRRTRYDFYWPTFAHLGEQSVLTNEIFMNDAASQTTVFGYQERYAEYRYKPSEIHGKFRSDAAGSLDTFHLSQDFGAAPTLSDTFIKETVPIDRVVAVTTEPPILLDAWFSLNCARVMPVYSVPGLGRL